MVLTDLSNGSPQSDKSTNKDAVRYFFNKVPVSHFFPTEFVCYQLHK